MHIEPPTPGTTRVVPVRRAAIVAVTALACVALVSACGSSSKKTTPAKTLNTAQVALSIEQTILTKRHLRAKVSCPAAVPQEKGRTFECIATSRGAKAPFTVTTTPFVVTIKSDRGYVEYAGK